MRFVKYDITFQLKQLSYLESEGEIFMRGRVNFKRQKCSFFSCGDIFRFSRVLRKGEAK